MTSYSKPKLDELIENLEESSDRLIDLVRVAETIKDLKAKQEDLLKGFESAKKEINKAGKDFAESKNEVLGGVDHLLLTTQNLEKITSHIPHVVSNALMEFNRKLDSRLKIIQDALDSGITSVKRENRQHYTDLETLVRLKLDENKAEIKQFIEHERGQLSVIIDTRLQQIEAYFIAEAEKRTTQLLESQQATRTALWMVGGVLICLIFAIMAFT